MIKVLLAHPGTQYSYHTAEQLKAIGVLRYFCTGLAIPDSFFTRILIKLFPALERRFVKNIPPAVLKTYPLIEILALIKIKKGSFYEDVFHKRNFSFQNEIAQKYLNDVDVIISYDTTSWVLASRAKKLNKKFILDASIGHPLFKEKVFFKIKNDFPSWNDVIISKKDEYIKNELTEMELADIIVVPSGFVRDTYIQNGIPENKIRINPFGTDLKYFRLKKYANKEKDDLIFLFFGALNARKGLPLLLKAWSILCHQNNSKLLLAGFDSIPETIQLPKNVVVLGPISPNDRCSLYHSADVFVFPSFFEGFAQVQIEAAACGLPLIVTYNSGGEEIVEQGENGFIINIDDVYSLVNAMKYFLDHPDKIIQMGKYSRKKAESFSWDAYGERWRNILNEAIEL